MSKKQEEIRIERAYGRACSGIETDMLDIPKVFAVGEKAIASGDDDAEFELLLATFREHPDGPEAAMSEKVAVLVISHGHGRRYQACSRRCPTSRA